MLRALGVALGGLKFLMSEVPLHTDFSSGQADLSSRLVKGIVMDHGARHPDMPKSPSTLHPNTNSVLAYGGDRCYRGTSLISNGPPCPSTAIEP